MKSNYKRLGNYIGAVDKRNRNLEIDNLIGLSIQKKFIPSISNTIGTDMSTYRKIKPNQFAYCPVTSRNGEKVTIALYQEGKTAIISQAYNVFEITHPRELNPEYLMMWFRRPEFDRYARFMSHGSVREMFSWEDMCEVMLPVPHLDKQNEIVEEYNTIVNRIALNTQLIQKLEETAQAIYNHLFVEGIDLENLPKGWRVGKVSDLCNYSSKKISLEELSIDNYISTENMLQDRSGVTSANNLPNAIHVTNFEIGNILISNIRPYFKKIWLANFRGGCSNDVLCLVPKAQIPSLYLYQLLEKDFFLSM